MKTSKEFLSELSNHIFTQITMYRFNKNTLKVTDKYREGRLTALKYVSELTLYYMNLEKTIPLMFREQIIKQMRSNSCLNDSDYKQGLYDALNEALDQYRERLEQK